MTSGKVKRQKMKKLMNEITSELKFFLYGLKLG